MCRLLNRFSHLQFTGCLFARVLKNIMGADPTGLSWPRTTGRTMWGERAWDSVVNTDQRPLSYKSHPQIWMDKPPGVERKSAVGLKNLRQFCREFKMCIGISLCILLFRSIYRLTAVELYFNMVCMLDDIQFYFDLSAFMNFHDKGWTIWAWH